MKTLFVLLFGAIIGVVGWRYYVRTQNPSLNQRVEHLGDKTRETAIEAREAVASKTEDWKLNTEAIKEELAKTGQVVRTKAKAAGEVIGDARIITVIKGKYVMEKELSAFAISVDCQDGQVRLTGSVSSADYIGRAVKLALETGGVHNVVSQLVVKN